MILATVLIVAFASALCGWIWSATREAPKDNVRPFRVPPERRWPGSEQ